MAAPTSKEGKEAVVAPPTTKEDNDIFSLVFVVVGVGGSEFAIGLDAGAEAVVAPVTNIGYNNFFSLVFVVVVVEVVVGGCDFVIDLDVGEEA